MTYNQFKLNLCEELSELEIKLLEEEIKNMSILEENQINFHTMYVCELNDKLEAKVIIRSTVKSSVFLDKITFILTDESERILGDQTVHLGFLGELPSFSVTPATVLLDRNKYDLENVDITKCKITVKMDFRESSSKKLKIRFLDESLDEVNKRLFEKFVDEYPPILDNTCEITNSKLIISDDVISVAFIIFNGYNREFTIGNLKIMIKDNLNIVKAHKEILELPAIIQPYTANVYNFIFEKDEIYTTNIDEIKQCRVSIGN